MNTLTGIQIEGNLITFDLTTELLSNELKGQTPKDFGIAQANKLEDEIAIAWGDAKTYWAAFQRRLAKLGETETATSLTREYWAVPLVESLGYKPEYQAKAEIVEGQTFAISHRAMREKTSHRFILLVVVCAWKNVSANQDYLPML